MSFSYNTSTYMSSSTASSTASPTGPKTLKPTILAFHGSGSNATCHSVQLARVGRYLKRDFEIESMDGPYPSAAGPGVLPFFEGMGPYKRWLPLSEKATLDNMKMGTGLSTLPKEAEDLVKTTCEKIRAKGGKVVGLIGFSQGTKVVAGLLRGTEIRRALLAKGEGGGEESSWLDFSFGLSVCGSYPPPLVPAAARNLLAASSLSSEEKEALETKKIQLSTLHMQGSMDEFAWAGKILIETSYEDGEGMSEVRVFEGGHLYPQKAEDTDGIVKWVTDVWGRVKEEGWEGR